MKFREKNKLLREENEHLYNENKRLKAQIEVKRMRNIRLLTELMSLRAEMLEMEASPDGTEGGEQGC